MNTDDVRGHNSPQLCLHSSSRYFWYGGVPMSLLSWRFLAFFHLDLLVGAACTMPRTSVELFECMC